MQISQAISLVFGRLGGRTVDNEVRSYIINELNAGQEQFESGPHLPYFLKHITSPVLTVDGNSEVTLPVDFIDLVEESPVLWINSNIRAALEYRPYDELFSKFGVTPQAGRTPAFYTKIRHNVWKLFPLTTSGTLVLHYFARQVQVTAGGLLPEGTTNPWYNYASGLLINKAAYEVAAKYIRDSELAAIIKPDLADNLVQLQALSIMQESTDRALAEPPIRRY